MAKIDEVVLVGHCGFDASSLASTVRRALDEAVPIRTIDSEQDLASHMSPRSLLLINRVLDGGFGIDSGVELIQRLGQQEQRPLMMLISNYPNAQQEAQSAGAMPGFGKSQLHDPAVAQRLRALMEW